MGEIKSIHTNIFPLNGSQAKTVQSTDETKAVEATDSGPIPKDASTPSQRDIELRKAEHELGAIARKAELSTQNLSAQQPMEQVTSALAESHENLRRTAEKMGDLHSKLSAKTDEVAKLAAAAEQSGKQGKALDHLFTGIRDLQQMNMSFNLMYLQLQSKMQDESRRFSLLINIMNTKHDTAKNSISNVR